VEEYFPSREVTVSGWAHRGAVTILAITDRVTREFRPTIGICLAHRFPSVYAAGHETEVTNLTRRAAMAFGIREGPIYFQFLIGDGAVVVNELAARIGGAYEEDSLPPVCGVDLLGLLIRGAFSGGADPGAGVTAVPRTAGAFSVPLMFCRPGIIADRGNLAAVRAVPGVKAARYLLTEGTRVGPVSSSGQRAAYLVAAGSDPSAVNRILRRALPRMALWDDRKNQLLNHGLRYALIPGDPVSRKSRF
jgi:hypothetical protein